MNLRGNSLDEEEFSIRTFARTVALGRVPFGASAVADSASYGDALSAARTLLSLGTTGQHAFPVHDLVRGLALALDTVALCVRIIILSSFKYELKCR